MVTIPRRQIGLDTGKLVPVFGPRHVALPGAGQAKGEGGSFALRHQPVEPAGEAGFITPVGQLPVSRRDISQQRPVVDPDRHVGHLDVLLRHCGQTLESSAQIVAKESQGSPDKRQSRVILNALPKQGLLGLGEQGEGIAVMMVLVVILGEAGAGTPGFQGGKRIGADDVKTVVSPQGAGGFQQDGPGLVLQAGKPGVERGLRVEMVDMQSWFHFLLHRQQFAPGSLAGSGGQAYHGRRHF